MPDVVITTYGGHDATGLNTVRHWQLLYKGQFIADSAAPHIVALFEEIAERLNGEPVGS